jgi:murein DD-endopeptidase MepM/ murein hydrolase activator NlpD
MKKLLTALIILSAYGEMSLAATAKDTSSYKKVRSGDTIYSILSHLGFNQAQRNLAMAASIVPKSFVLAPGDLYRIVHLPKNKKTEVHFFDAHKPTAFAFWKQGRDDGGGETLKLDLEKKTQTVSGKIYGSLVGAIREKTNDDQLGYRFMDAYLLDYTDVAKKIQRGAKFSLTYEKLYQDGVFIRNGEILKSELDVQGQKETRQYLSLSNGGVYVGGPSLSNRPLYAPVNLIRISSLYQPRRFHPIKKYRKAHLGVDFELPAGEPVLAAQDGRIVRFGKTRGAGNYVVIRHSNGLESYYNHMQSLSNSLRKGAMIDAGTPVGAIGCTGYCTKPHLHFAVKKSGKFINPVKYIRGYAAGQRKDVSRHVANSDD